MLLRKGRLDVATNDRAAWVREALVRMPVHVLPVDADMLIVSETLEAFPNSDPADRLIVATALLRALPIVSSDGAMHRWAKQTGAIRVIG